METRPEIIVLSRDGLQKGRVINWDAKKCLLEGCLSFCASVRWEDGKLTYPCHAGLKGIEANLYQII